MVTVAVNDRPLEVAALVRHGRVLLPMRATFAALRATLYYDSHGRVVVARAAGHDVHLAIGSHVAQVDGTRIRLDVPAQIIAARTFVPVRFVAQALGASVGYDAAAALVTVTSPEHAGAPIKVSQLTPSPGVDVATAYPNITATLAGATAARDGISLSIDSQDVTSLATFDGSTVTYLPRTALTAGTHTVDFSGHTVSGNAFDEKWSFTTTSTPPAEESAPVENYGYQFYSSGNTWYRYGDWMHFTLMAPPGGSAYLQLCGTGNQYSFWNGGNTNTYVADVPAPYGYWIPTCQVSAYYTAWNGQVYFIPLPLIVGLYTLPQQPYGFVPTPSPSPASTTVPLPPDKRRPEGTPSPAPIGRTPMPIKSPLPIKPIPIKPIPVRPPLPIKQPFPIKPPSPIKPITVKPIPVRPIVVKPVEVRPSSAKPAKPGGGGTTPA